MHEYEIRVLKDGRRPSMTMLSIHFNDNAAIRAGRKMAQGQPFEVWRDDACVYGTDDDKPLPFPIHRPPV